MKWNVLRYLPTERTYEVLKIVEAEHAPAALLKSGYSGDRMVIVRPVNDTTVPVKS